MSPCNHLLKRGREEKRVEGKSGMIEEERIGGQSGMIEGQSGMKEGERVQFERVV